MGIALVQTIISSRTTNKNASNAVILLEAGRLCGTSTVIIVSNDKIFEDVVDDHHIYQVRYTSSCKKTTPKKNVIIQAMRKLIAIREPESIDLFLCDIYNSLGCSSLSALRDYTNKFIPELCVAVNDSVFSV